ncbi:transcription elongation factor GreA, partial [Streptomyces sp. NPDC056728]
SGVNGNKMGEDALYEVPNGKLASVKILEAKPYRG